MDYLGADVVVRLLLGCAVLLPSRDKFAKHLAPQDEETKEIDGRREADMRTGHDVG